MAEWLRPPKIRLVVKEVEIERHHGVDRRGGCLVEDQCFFRHVPVAIEMAPPEPVAYEHGWRVVVHLIFRIAEDVPRTAAARR
jgi:hypothetical protein